MVSRTSPLNTPIADIGVDIVLRHSGTCRLVARCTGTDYVRRSFTFIGSTFFFGLTMPSISVASFSKASFFSS